MPALPALAFFLRFNLAFATVSALPVISRFIVLLACALPVATPAARAQTVHAPAPAPAVNLIVTPAYVSQYLFRGQRLGGQSFQPTLELGYGNLGVGVWANFPVSSKVAGVSDPEVDPYAYYMFALTDTISLVPGFTYYTYPRAETRHGFYRSTFEPNLAVSWSVKGVKLTPKVYYDLTLDGPTFEITAGYAVPLRQLGTELDFTLQAGEYLQRDVVNHSAAQTKAWGQYWLVGMAVPFQFSAHSKFTLGFAYTEGVKAFTKAGSTPRIPNVLAVRRGVVNFSYTRSF